MKLYTNVWVECEGVGSNGCPFNSAANPAVRLSRNSADRGLYSVHSDSLRERLELIGWRRPPDQHSPVCPACAKVP